MWPVAAITFLEGIRSRVLYGIFIFACSVILLSFVFAHFFMQDIGKVAVDFNLAALSLAGLLMSLSISVDLIGKDLDKKTIYFVLSKPISRNAYILGKYSGILLISLMAYLIIALLTCFALMLLQSFHADYFKNFAWLPYMQAVFLDYIKISLFNALILFFGSFSTSSFLNMMFSLCIYIAGQSYSDVIRFLSVQHHGEQISPVVHYVIQTSKYIVPNFELFDMKILAAHGRLMAFSDLIPIMGYGFAYIALLVGLSMIIFRKKEFL